MGGINHQPCNKFVAESTRLSRCVSLARINFEQGNVALEDVIILELEGKKGSVSPIKHHLQLSQDHILAAVGQLSALEAKMKELDYHDLSALHKLDEVEFGRKLVEAGLVEQGSWTKMSSMMKTSTFFANVAEFKTQFHSLLKLTSDLLTAVTQLTDSADDGQLHDVVEENWRGNIKVEFARLYTAWNRLHSDFLASSLVSTEVWYLENGFRSLLEAPKHAVVA